MIGIADVDVFVPKGSPIDDHAAQQATTVYAAVQTFPMLPNQLSTGTTSLLPDVDRLCIVVEFAVDTEGQIGESEVYRALLRNRAQLTYNAVGAWFEGSGPAPGRGAASGELQTQLKLQDQVAQTRRRDRYRRGALNIETTEVNPVMSNGQVVDIVKRQKNRATDLVEDFMVASNGVMARALQAKNLSCIRRVVKTPKRWNRIVELAAKQGGRLPVDPDPKALSNFMNMRKVGDPEHFADLSLAMIKLMGPGEYVLERPGDPRQGHVGLAVGDYTHSKPRPIGDLST
jgi:VacB/RNase II family 3'-5' exoribonuclease